MTPLSVATLFSLLCASRASLGGDQNALLQGRMQLMGVSPRKAQQVPAAAGTGEKDAASEDYAGRVRQSLTTLFRFSATDETAEQLAGLCAEALERGKKAMDLPDEADEIYARLLEVAVEVLEGAELAGAWGGRIPRVAALAEGLAAKLERPLEPGHQPESLLGWAAGEFAGLQERLVPGQPAAAAARGMLLAAESYAAKVRAPQALMEAFGKVDAALVRGDFARPAAGARAAAAMLEAAAARGVAAQPLADLAGLVRYFGEALEAGGRQPESLREAVAQVSRYAEAGHRPPLPEEQQQLLLRLLGAKSPEQAAGAWLEGAAGLLKAQGPAFGLPQGLVRAAGNVLEMVQNGTASLGSAQEVARTLQRAAGDGALLPAALLKPAAAQGQGEGAAGAGAGGQGLAAALGLLARVRAGMPAWSVELGDQLAARLWGAVQRSLGPEARPPSSLGELLGGSAPAVPGRPALQGLLEAAVGGGLEQTLAGDRQAAGRLLRTWARELREELQ